MARRKKGSEPIGIGYTSKQMKRKKPVNSDYLVNIEPLTDNQKLLFDAYNKGQHIVAFGCAGTGKTFISLYNAIQDVLSCLLYTSPSPRDCKTSRMPSSA